MMMANGDGSDGWLTVVIGGSGGNDDDNTQKYTHVYVHLCIYGYIFMCERKHMFTFIRLCSKEKFVQY